MRLAIVALLAIMPFVLTTPVEIQPRQIPSISSIPGFSAVVASLTPAQQAQLPTGTISDLHLTPKQLTQFTTLTGATPAQLSSLKFSDIITLIIQKQINAAIPKTPKRQIGGLLGGTGADPLSGLLGGLLGGLSARGGKVERQSVSLNPLQGVTTGLHNGSPAGSLTGGSDPVTPLVDTLLGGFIAN